MKSTRPGSAASASSCSSITGSLTRSIGGTTGATLGHPHPLIGARSLPWLRPHPLIMGKSTPLPPGTSTAHVLTIRIHYWIGARTSKFVGGKLNKVSKLERGKNGIGILVDRDLRELVVEIWRVNDRLMAIKLGIGGSTLNVISAYAPQVGLDEEIKKHFWEEFDGCTWHSAHQEVIHRRVRNRGGTVLLDCDKALDLVIANSCFLKRDKHVDTFWSSLAKTQIDYLLLRKCDRSLCMDCKVMPGENVTTQHRLLVKDIEIVRKRRKKADDAQL
ncbi:PREDICTED: uncharacterized protein LOC109241797 [Nicotiana attenuata]|uniref:uncharacterized protein LOC109241797 n=1 Tax=Nicotiana attenuata TaxID=49451 RepID=UPI000904DA58|nr:PREDICTED: uncharacterized protein LOC109241797 [Nicotiana attenuata]